MKTVAEGKAITEEIAKLLPKATEETKKDLLIILQWENMKKSNKTDREAAMNEKPEANNEKKEMV